MDRFLSDNEGSKMWDRICSFSIATICEVFAQETASVGGVLLLPVKTSTEGTVFPDSLRGHVRHSLESC